MLCFLLACSLLSQSSQDRPPSEIPATRVEVNNRNHQLVALAYDNIAKLPGYQLEQSHVLIDAGQREISYLATSAYDENGNRHANIQVMDQPVVELYAVQEEQYIFDPKYQAWVNVARRPAEETQVILPSTLGIIENPTQLLAQFGAVPIEPVADTVDNRPAMRYRLAPFIATMAETGEQRSTALPISLTGNIWVDDESGALLKSEIAFYESETGQLIQAHKMEVSRIGQIEKIELPDPIIDPIAIVSATATAQVWTVLNGHMNYRGTPITFELIPLAVRQIPDTSPLSGEVSLLIRALPDHVVLDGELDPFLSQLRQQLKLSIPNRNLIVTSSGYKSGRRPEGNPEFRASYTFNVDLEDFERVELILSGPGNPQYAPVPVEQ